MPIIALNIPEKEVDFFLKLANKFNYKSVNTEELIISEDVKKLVTNRKKTAKAKDYIKSKDAMSRLKLKYGF